LSQWSELVPYPNAGHSSLNAPVRSPVNQSRTSLQESCGLESRIWWSYLAHLIAPLLHQWSGRLVNAAPVWANESPSSGQCLAVRYERGSESIALVSTPFA